MSTYASTTHTGWFDNLAQTGASVSHLKLIAFTTAAISASYLDSQSTNFDFTNRALSERSITRYSEAAPGLAKSQDVKERLTLINKVFKFSISRLSVVLGTSRQTIYNWQSGEQPSDSNLDKIQDLLNASNVFSDSGIEVTGVLMKRKIVGGKSLLDLALSGKDLTQAATLLVNQIRLEKGQQTLLSNRLAARQSRITLGDNDLG